MGIFEKAVIPKRDASYWKSKAEEYERAWRFEMLQNQAWANAICNASLMHKISFEGQQALYELHEGEMKSIRKLMGQ